MPNVPEYLLALAHAAAAPISLQGKACEEIRPGQVWRARWEATSVPVLIIDTLSDDNNELCVSVVPMTIEPHGENDQALVVDSEANIFGVAATLWIGLNRKIPLRTFDVCFGDMPDRITTYCDFASRGEMVEPPHGTRVGRRDPSVFADDAEIEATLEDELAELERVQGLVIEDSEKARQLLLKQLTQVDLESAMAELNMNQAAAMEVLRGHAHLTADQTNILARLANLNPDDISRIFKRLPSAVILAVEHPRWRQQLDHIATRAQRGINEVREEAAHEILEMAARQTSSSRTYDDRLAHWIGVHLPSATSDQT